MEAYIMAMKPSKNYIRLTRQLPDLEAHIKQGKLNVVPLLRNDKYPIIMDWQNRIYSLTDSFTYINKKGKKVTQKGLKYHTGNYGILIGYGNSTNGYSIGCIDIDGYKTDPDKPDLELKAKTQKLIYEVLKDIPNTLQVKTQSGGYHIYIFTRKTQPNTSITSKSLYYPQDFPITELQGKNLLDSIEIFTNQDKKQTVLPGSKTKLKANGYKIREYTVISEVNKFSDIDIVDDLNQLVIDTLVSKGYTYKPSNEPETSKPKTYKGKRSQNHKLKELSQDEIDEVIQTLIPVFKIPGMAKHKADLYLGGYFSYHITKDSSSKIADGVIKEIGNIFKDTDHFKRTLINNYSKEDAKAGLPKLSNHILSYDKTFNISKFTDKLNSICYPDYKKRITRPIISKPFNIQPYLEANGSYNNKVYLGYIYQNKSYVLISEKETDFYFKPLAINYDPITLYNRTGNANWEAMETELNSILGTGKDEVINQIITELLGNLKDLYINSHFTTLRQFPRGLKQFIQDPITVYNNFSNYEFDSSTTKTAKDEIETHINSIISIYNNKSLEITNKWINDQILYLANYTSKDPFLNLHLGNRPVKYHQARAGNYIVKEFGLKRHLKDSKETLYLYNQDLKYFDKVTVPQLKNKLYNTLGYNLTETDINGLTKAISNEDKLLNNLLVFRNMYFDIDTLHEFKPLLEVTTYNRQDYLTVNNIGVFNESTNSIALLDYDKGLKLEDILTVKGIETTDDDGNKTTKLPAINPNLPVSEYKKEYGMTLTELVLRQILIPKDNPDNILLFRDYLERLGSNIYGSNLYKVLTFYYNDGDGGKSILNLFNNLIFNKLNYELKPEDLKDGFNLENFYNRLCITIDEITRDSFNDLKDILKRMTSKYSKTESRQMYSTETFTLYSYPNLYIYSNELLDLNPVTDGAIFSRIDYLKLPNKFVDKSELSIYNNSYPVVEGLEEMLKQDLDGLSWLITAGILCFKNMKAKKNRYTLRQTREDTINIFLNADDLTRYLTVYTEFVDDLPRESFTSNNDILNGYLEYMAGLNKEVSTEGLAKEIGLKLNKLYPELKQDSNKYKDYDNGGGKRYKLKLKSSEDLIKEYNEAYTINEYATDRQLSVLDNNGNLKTVYKQIQQGNCTISILTNKLPNINCIDIVQQLESFELIYNTGQTINNELMEAK